MQEQKKARGISESVGYEPTIKPFYFQDTHGPNTAIYSVLMKETQTSSGLEHNFKTLNEAFI